MPSIGIQDKRFVTSIQLMDAREIMDKIVDQSNERQFADIAKLIGRYKETTFPIYHNHVNEDTSIIGIVGGGIVGNNTPTLTVALTLGSSGAWRRGTIVKINGKNALISNVTTAAGIDTLTLTSANGTNLTAAATNQVTFSSFAAGSGAKPGVGIRFRTTPYSNKIQIIEHYAPDITDIQSMSRVEIADKGIYGYQRDQDMLLLKKAISGALIGGQQSVAQFGDAIVGLPDKDGAPIQLTSGLDEQISTYGGLRSLTVLGTVDLDQIAIREDAMIARKAPKDYMVIGSTAAMRPYSNFLKGLNSSGVTSARMNIDGREVDLVVNKYSSVGGFNYDFVNIATFDDPTMYPATSSDIGRSLYYVPKDSVALVGGGTSKRFLVRFLRNQYLQKSVGPNVSWEDMIAEKNWGGLAPHSTDGDNVLHTKWTTYQGLELLGVRHFSKEIIF